MKPWQSRLQAHTQALRDALHGSEFRCCPYCPRQLAINRPKELLLHAEPLCEPFVAVAVASDSFGEALLVITSPAVFA